MRCAVLPGSSSAPVTKEATCSTCPPPRTCNYVQNIRVNVHFLQHDDGSGNFAADDDGRPGNPSPNTTGYGYAQALIYACNGQMNQNPVLRLSPGSSLTPIPKRVRWVLDGVYFDRNSIFRDGAYANGSPSHDYDPLCVRADSVVNIFLVEEVDWPYVGPRGNINTNNPVPLPQTRGYVFVSNQARCDLYSASAKLWAVVASPWTKYILAGTGAWEMASAVNHELCHLLGLNHPFQSTSFNWGVCPDAPGHPDFPAIEQCWNMNKPAGPYCNVQSKVSNNLMDYNAAQAALAPCQIGIIQNNLNTCLQSRYVYKCSDVLPSTATFEVPTTTACLPTPIWLDSRAAFNYNWYKLEIDEVSTAGGIVAGTHYESEAYYQTLGRIRLDALYAFNAGRSYRVRLYTHPSGASVATAVQVHTLTTPPCVRIPDPQRGTPATTVISSPFRK